MLYLLNNFGFNLRSISNNLLRRRHTHLFKPIIGTRLRKKLLKRTIKLLAHFKRQSLKHILSLINTIKSISHISRKIGHICIEALRFRKRISLAICKTGKNHIDIDRISKRLNIIIEIFSTFFLENNATISIITTSVKGFDRVARVSGNPITGGILSIKHQHHHKPPSYQEK